MSKFKSNCPCPDIVVCPICGKQVCWEAHLANVHTCFHRKCKESKCKAKEARKLLGKFQRFATAPAD